MDIIQDTFPNISSFLDEVARLSEIQSNHIDEYLSSMNHEEKEALERRIEYLHRIENNSYLQIAECYLTWCTYFMEERKYFVTHDEQYRNHTYAEIHAYYQDKDYMKNYMVGLSISVYLLNIQRKNLVFFKEHCLKDKHVGGKYLEVGPGHGEYLSIAMENTNFDAYIGIDISPSSTERTSKFLNYYFRNKPDLLRRLEIKCEDFFKFEENDKFDAIVISQVIEHVENPGDFLRKTRKLADKNALIFVSTAINSPFPDHIYHFHDSDEVRSLIRTSGLEIIDEFQSTSDGISLDKAIRKKYDIVIGFILKPVEQDE